MDGVSLQNPAPQIPITESRRCEMRIEQTDIAQDRARNEEARVSQKIEKLQPVMRDRIFAKVFPISVPVEPGDVSVHHRLWRCQIYQARKRTRIENEIVEAERNVFASCALKGFILRYGRQSDVLRMPEATYTPVHFHERFDLFGCAVGRSIIDDNELDLS